MCKYVISKLLPFILKKINELDEKLKKSKTEDIELALLLGKYLDLEDDLYAIASYR